jgi:hypothetical protein
MQTKVNKGQKERKVTETVIIKEGKTDIESKIKIREAE